MLEGINLSIKIQGFPLGVLQTNCFVVYNEKGNAVVIDVEERHDKLKNFITENNLNVQMILLTHCHFDHIRGVDDIRKLTNAKVAVAKQNVDYGENGEPYVEILPSRYYQGNFYPDILFEDGDTFYLDETPINIYVGSGHSRADCAFKIENHLFSGDALFAGTIGRTDFEYGDYNSLVKFVKRFKEFPQETMIYPGHGPFTTIGQELKVNQYMIGD